MVNYAIRIAMSFEDASNNRIIQYLADRSDEAVFYEHSLATRTSKGKTHIHGYLAGCTVGSKSIYSQLTKHGAPSGNAGRSCSETFGKEPDIKPVDRGYITYSSKGRLEPCYVKGVSETEIKTLTSEWVDYGDKSGLQGQQADPDKKPVKKSTQYDQYCEIVEILSTKTYKCHCYDCKHNRPYTDQTLLDDGTVKWSHNMLTHQNSQVMVQTIIQVRKKYRELTCPKVLEKFIFMILNDNREMECNYHALVSRNNFSP